MVLRRALEFGVRRREELEGLPECRHGEPSGPAERVLQFEVALVGLGEQFLEVSLLAALVGHDLRAVHVGVGGDQRAEDHHGFRLHVEEDAESLEHTVEVVVEKGVDHLERGGFQRLDADRVDVRFGDFTVGVVAELFDLRDEVAHVFPDVVEKVLGGIGRDDPLRLFALGDDELHEVLAGAGIEVRDGTDFVDERQHLLHLFGLLGEPDGVLPEDERAGVRRVRQKVDQRFAVGVGQLLEVEVVDEHTGPLTHGGQRFHALHEFVHGDVLAVEFMIVEHLQAGRHDAVSKEVRVFQFEVGLVPFDEVNGQIFL